MNKELKAADEAVTLAACPIGLFMAGGELCLKTEYSDNEGRIDAYIVSSGEFFWGSAPQTIANQRQQMVSPVELMPYSNTPIPRDIAEAVASIGEAEWGATRAQDDAAHVADFGNSLRLTREHFGTDGPQQLHGLYLKGTETVLCHTGTSPNSAVHAQALTGAWNWLLEQSRAARKDER